LDVVLSKLLWPLVVAVIIVTEAVISVLVLVQLGDGSDWWAELLQSVIYAQLDAQLVSRVKEDLLDNVDTDKINMANKFVISMAAWVPSTLNVPAWIQLGISLKVWPSLGNFGLL